MMICIILILIVDLIWLLKNRNTIKKLIKCTWAHHSVMNSKVKENKIADDNWMDEKENNNKKPSGALAKILNIIEEHPEFAEAIAEENERKAKEKDIEDAKYNFPIKRSEAIQIAKKDSNLKTDFCKNSKRKRYFLSFIS